MIAEVADLTPTGQTVLTSTYAYFTAGTSDERLQTLTNSGSSGNIISQFTYAYSPAGDITSWTQQADSNTPDVYGYGYDGARELLSAVKTSSTGGAKNAWGHISTNNKEIDASHHFGNKCLMTKTLENDALAVCRHPPNR
jgi:hypothetical protein